MKLLVSILIFLLIPITINGIDVVLGINTQVMQPCDVSVSIITSKESYQEGEKIEFFNKLSNTNHKYKIEYWLENENGTVLYKNKNTTNTKKKSITLSKTMLKKIDTDMILLRNKIYIECDDINESDNSAEKVLNINREKILSKKDKKSDKQPKSKKQTDAQSNTDKNSSKQADTLVYSSSNTKIKKIAPWLFIAITTILCIILIWKR